MKRAIVTGAGGLVGSETTKLLIEEGFDVTGIDNNMRQYFFGEEGSTFDTLQELDDRPEFVSVRKDIRDEVGMASIVERTKPDLIVHAAAQPSHDWAAREPTTDFGVNAIGTLNMLEAARKYAPDATFAHISTSKVYGTNPNSLPFWDFGSRLDLPTAHPYYYGIDIDLSVDVTLHSLFGASKLSGDVLAQEYGRYFKMPVVIFRPGCITGPAHAGVELHGFLAYLMKATVQQRPYTVYGYEGKQVRCNIYARDLAKAALEYHRCAKFAGAVYNIGGGRDSACSMLEAISACEDISGNTLDYEYDPKNRIGDHRWWISDISRFQSDYPEWKPTLDVRELLQKIHDENREEWLAC